MRTAAEVWERGSACLARDVFDYVMGGAGSERAVRSNREAVESIAFLPRLLSGVTDARTTTTVLGTEVDLPVFCAPVGSLELFAERAVQCVLAASASVGAFAMPGLLALQDLPTLDTVLPATAVLQLYLRGDDEWLKAIVREAKRVEFRGLCVTVDSPVPAYRPRDRRNDFRHRATIGPAANVDTGTEGREHQARLTWERLDRLRESTDLPLGVKGVLRPSDASRAAALGCDFVYVSNHGGRNVGATPPPIDMLPSVVEALDGRAQVFVDGGFRDGEDVAKALALGASAVGLGRAHCLALAADGQQGLEVLLEEVGRQLQTTMTLLGVPSVHDLGSDLVSWDRLGDGSSLSTRFQRALL